MMKAYSGACQDPASGVLWGGCPQKQPVTKSLTHNLPVTPVLDSFLPINLYSLSVEFFQTLNPEPKAGCAYAGNPNVKSLQVLASFSDRRRMPDWV